MVLVVKVLLKEIGKTRKDLGKDIDKKYPIIKDKQFGYIPINGDVKISKKYKIVNKRIDKLKEKKNYKTELKKILSEEEYNLIPTSFDQIGDICIVRLEDNLLKKRKKIGKALLCLPNTNTVLMRTGKYSGEYRVQKLKRLAGKWTKETIHRESGIQLKLNIEKVYFSVRSSTERLRIRKQVKSREKILVMFSGCGPFCFVIGKGKDVEIMGVEKNPAGHKYAKQNIILNKANNVEVYKGDVRKVVPKLNKVFDRIIMPLPKSAEEFLDVVKDASKKGTIIHLYQFGPWESQSKMRKKYRKVISKYIKQFKIQNIAKAGDYSPGVFRICVDFVVQ